MSHKSSHHIIGPFDYLKQNQILELSWDGSPPVFLSWIRGRQTTAQDNPVELSRQLAEKLGLKEGEQVTLTLELQKRLTYRSVCHRKNSPNLQS